MQLTSGQIEEDQDHYIAQLEDVGPAPARLMIQKATIEPWGMTKVSSPSAPCYGHPFNRALS